MELIAFHLYINSVVLSFLLLLIGAISSKQALDLAQIHTYRISSTAWQRQATLALAMLSGLRHLGSLSVI